MPRLRSRLLVSVLALFAFVFLVPALATALPQGEAFLSAAEHPVAGPGLFSQFWSFLSALWSENGSVLAPNGATAGSVPGSSAEPDATSSGDNGSGLDPNG